MNASKENARKARRLLKTIVVDGLRPSDEDVQFVNDFIDACEGKLPRESSFKAEKRRRREKASA